MPVIVVSVIPTIPKQPEFKFPQKPKPGLQIPFTEDVVLKEYDVATAGNGLPQNEANRYAGTHSGFLTLLRITGQGIASIRLASLSINTRRRTSSTIFPTLL